MLNTAAPSEEPGHPPRPGNLAAGAQLSMRHLVPSLPPPPIPRPWVLRAARPPPLRRQARAAQRAPLEGMPGAVFVPWHQAAWCLAFICTVVPSGNPGALSSHMAGRQAHKEAGKLALPGRRAECHSRLLSPPRMSASHLPPGRMLQSAASGPVPGNRLLPAITLRIL